MISELSRYLLATTQPLIYKIFMRRHRQAKIVVTLGPSVSTKKSIRTLFEAGADVFRLNFSHGTHKDHASRIAAIRSIERETNRPLGILTDLQGPKLRIGTFMNGEVTLKSGSNFKLDLDPSPGDVSRVSLPHKKIFSIFSKGIIILLDDGKLRLSVVKTGKNYVIAKVINGGKLSDHKGVNVPNVTLPIPALDNKDRQDLKFALKNGVDYIGLSFIQSTKDIIEVRKIVGKRASILSKLEKPTAIEHLKGIIEESDAVMVARGDLGVELPPEDIPSLQKKIIRECQEQGKPVVVATQMLESMVKSPSPTRAEASDVATAIYDGADAVMLSAETAVGDYPVQAVKMMDRIILRVEKDPEFWSIIETGHKNPEANAADAITAAARQVAHTISATTIVTYTTSGSTALRAARERPDVPILCITKKIETARRLALTWGVQCVVAEDVKNFSGMVNKANGSAKEYGFARKSDRIVITAGVPFGTPGATNILRISKVN